MADQGWIQAARAVGRDVAGRWVDVPAGGWQNPRLARGLLPDCSCPRTYQWSQGRKHASSCARADIPVIGQTHVGPAETTITVRGEVVRSDGGACEGCRALIVGRCFNTRLGSLPEAHGPYHERGMIGGHDVLVTTTGRYGLGHAITPEHKAACLARHRGGLPSKTALGRGHRCTQLARLRQKLEGR